MPWRGLGRYLVWLLLLSLPLQGLASIVEHIRGAVHVHATAAAQAAALPPGMSMLLAVDLLRHSHGAGRALAAAEEAPHAHAEPARHHHAVGDADVIAVDDPAAEAAADHRGKRLLLDLDTPPVPALATPGAALPAVHLTQAGPGAAKPPGGRLERPPRG